MGENIKHSDINYYKNIFKQDYLQMFSTYEDNIYK